MKRVPFLCLAIALASLSVATMTESPERTRSYRNRTYGFELEPPVFPKGGAGDSHIVAVFLANPSGGFAANVNTTVQNTATSRAQYSEVTRREFAAAGFTVRNETDTTVQGRDSVLWEYEGSMNGRELHWLALAVIDKDRVFLTTCTATQAEFTKHEEQFRACLESFRFE